MLPPRVPPLNKHKPRLQQQRIQVCYYSLLRLNLCCLKKIRLLRKPLKRYKVPALKLDLIVLQLYPVLAIAQMHLQNNCRRQMPQEMLKLVPMPLLLLALMRLPLLGISSQD
jgi:hypothetical protein